MNVCDVPDRDVRCEKLSGRAETTLTFVPKSDQNHLTLPSPIRVDRAHTQTCDATAMRQTRTSPSRLFQIQTFRH